MDRPCWRELWRISRVWARCGVLCWKIFTADTNYHSDTKSAEMPRVASKCLFPDIYFRRRDPRYARAQTAVLAPAEAVCLRGFIITRRLPTTTCALRETDLGVRLKQIYREGMVHRIYAAEEKDCGCCPLQLRCITNKGGKRKYLRVPIGVELANLLREWPPRLIVNWGERSTRNGLPWPNPSLPTSELRSALDRLRSGERSRLISNGFCTV